MPALRTGLWATGGVLAVAAIGGGVYGVLTADPPDPDPAPGLVAATPFITPGKTRPATVPAGAAGLADDELVIGVVAGDRARAYRVGALAGMTGQVVNDVVGGVPVTVTHCNQTGQSRVFTGEGSEPLPVMTGGYMTGGGLLLLVDGAFYRQADGRPPGGPAPGFPYPAMGFRNVTWKEWRTSHPETDVYVGDPPPKPPDGRRPSPPPGP